MYKTKVFKKAYKQFFLKKEKIKLIYRKDHIEKLGLKSSNFLKIQTKDFVYK